MKCSAKQLPFICASIALISAGVLFFAFPIRNIFEAVLQRGGGALLVVPVFATVSQGLLFILVCSTFFLASFVDPGIYPRESTDDEDDYRQPLYKMVDINGASMRMKWCDTCRFYRPPRCSHCSICDNCVERFDHHCPWVDNCVGKRNYKYFFVFVNSLTLFIVIGYAWGIVSIVLQYQQPINIIVECVLMVVVLPVFGLVCGLAGFHVALVGCGRTTNEHVTGKFRGGYNPYNQGCVRNYLAILCAPKYSRYMHYKMKYYTFPADSSPVQRAEDSTIRMGCVTEGIDRREMVSTLQCSGNGQESRGSSTLMSKLLQSSPEDSPRGETASSNGKIPAMPPQQATISHDWSQQRLQETPLDDDGRSTGTPPHVESGPASGNDSQRQYTYGFEVDV